jgi:hypothetical protein
LAPNIDPVTARTGKWTADEDKKLKDAVPAQGYTDWDTIPFRAGKLTADEDQELKDALDYARNKRK